MKHTPGPWRVRRRINTEVGDHTKIAEVMYDIAAGKEERRKNKGIFHPDDEYFYIDELHPVQCGMDRDYHTWEGGIENEADAKLMAAAPDLYEALREMSVFGSCSMESTWEKVLNALAKAEGRK